MSSGPEISVTLGDASKWHGSGVDLVFTHPYAPLPVALHGKPSLINLYHPAGQPTSLRTDITSKWIGGTELHRLGSWGHGHRNTLYCANLPAVEVDIGDLVEDPYKPGIGWFPIELPLRAFSAYRFKPASIVWDGFCGRGTVGKACQRLGYSYIGVDIDPVHVALARNYLELE